MTFRKTFTLVVSVVANEGRKILKSNTYTAQLEKIGCCLVKRIKCIFNLYK